MEKSNILLNTVDELKLLSHQHQKVIVSFSGGKDSMVILDLCSRIFRKVTCFFMYLVPGLEVAERQLDIVRTHYKFPIVQYPHWQITRYIKYGVYYPNHVKFDDVPQLTLADMYTLVRADTGIQLVVTGAKESDGLQRKHFFANIAKSDKFKDVVYPIKKWNKYDVLAYLKAQNIPEPPSHGTFASGIELTTASLLWLFHEYPSDFKKIEKAFPYIGAVPHREAWYGIK